MSQGLLLGIDVGTGSTKGVLTTVEGEIVATVTVEHGMDVPRPGWAEQDADGVWWHDVVAVCRELLNGDPYRGEDVAGVAVSAIGPCLLPLDGQGRPLRKGILYGVDTRAAHEIDELTAAIGADEVLSFSKMAFTSQAIGPKIAWLRRHEPDVWARTERLETASSYLVYRLTGRHVMDRHTASHWMPLMEMESLAWSDRFADLVAPVEMLPRLGWSDELAGTVSAVAAEETGLAPGTPVAVGAVDALSEAISVGAVQPGDLMVMYGSTTFFILVLERPLADPRVWMTAGAFEPQYALAAGMSTTGSLTKWIRDEFARELPAGEAYATLFERAAGVPAGSGGLLVLPYFSGERTPINDPNARGVIAGLTLAHGRDQLFRAALEGVAHGIAQNLDAFEQLGAPVRRLLAVGGGAQGGLWPQIVSDVTGREQIVRDVNVGASYGDAFLAGRAAGLLKREDLARWVRGEARIVPDTAAHERYTIDRPLFRKLYLDTRETVHALGTHARSSHARSSHRLPYSDPMRTRSIGSLTVSVVGLGCNNFGRRLDLDETKSVVDAALNAGVTFLDTADVYGGTDSEAFLGRVLAGRRDEVVLATKFGAPSTDNELSGARPETVRAALEASLRRLRVDHVDLYQLHFPDPDVPIADTLGALGEAVDAGLVREIGCSNMSATQLDEAEAAAEEHGTPRFVSVQNEYSLLRREAEAEVLPACERLDIAFLPYFPLLSGILTGKYRKGRPLPEGTRVRGNERWESLLTDELLDVVERLAEAAESHGRELIDLAFAYLLAQPQVASVIAGATKPEQVRRNVQAGAWELDAEQLAEVRSILDEAGEVAQRS